MQSRSSTRPPAPLLLAIIAECFAALLGGVLGSFLIGYGMGVLLLVTNIVQDTDTVFSVMLYSGLGGFVIGASAGVALAGRLLRQGGNLWLTLSGALGGLLLALVFVVLRNGDLSNMPIVAVLVPVLAIVSYNLRRNVL